MSHIIHIFNGDTQEIVEREMTATELAELNEFQSKATAAREARIAEQEKLKQNKISAYQKLGLTEAEIEALLPAPIEE